MAKPQLYKPLPRRNVLLAFGTAAALHAAAVVIAGLEPEEPPVVAPDLEQIAEVTFEDPDPAPPEPTPPPEEFEPPPPPPPTLETPEFVEEEATPPPKPRTPSNKPPPPIQRPRTPAQPSGSASLSAVKVKAISRPKPEYPYAARKSKLQGSGVCVLTVDASGTVSNATMAQSTGHPILDNATTAAFKRWRFQPGVPPRIKVPITYTMSGAQF